MTRRDPTERETATSRPPLSSVFKSRFSPLDSLLEIISRASFIFRAPVSSFCDLATCDEHGLISTRGDYATVVRIRGMRRIAGRPAIEASAARLRLALASLFNEPGHAMQFCYVADPDLINTTIASNLADRRTVASSLGAEFEDIFAERMRVLPPFMRHERIWLVLWTRPGRLTRQEVSQARHRRKQALRDLLPLGDAQNPLLGGAELGTIHRTFVTAVLQAFDTENVTADALSPRDGLRAIREELYPETMGSGWTPITPQDPPPNIIPEEDLPVDASDMLWPPLREQLFLDDALTPDFDTARLGTLDWTPVELTRVSEDVRPLTELTARLAALRMPWRGSALIEGVRPSYMLWKAQLAQFLKFGTNTPISAAFDDLKRLRETQTDAVVKLRMGFATMAPAGDVGTLRTRASRLQQAIGSWGGAQASRVCGDPLAGVLATAPGLAIAATAPPTAAPLAAALTMMPWARAAAPYDVKDGAVLFRAGDGTVVAYDPAGSGRDATLDIWVAPSRRGKTMLSNVMLFGTVLSHAVMTSAGPRLPLIGKLDIGDASGGLVDMITNGLPEETRHQVLHVALELIDEHAVNIFDTEACCRRPLDYHRTFLSNFLGLVCTPPGGRSFEAMNQLIDAVIEAVYDLHADQGPSTRPKAYRPGTDPIIDRAIDKRRIDVSANATWWHVADLLANSGDMRAARVATQYAVPVIGDLISATNEQRIRADFSKPTPTGGSETIIDVFKRYINHFTRRYPTLCRPTKLDLGDARIVVLDIDRVAPDGKGEENQRQTELMYLLGFQIVSRNFFLRPEDANTDMVPDHVREKHRQRFIEFKESFKRLECDEFQRTAGAPHIQQQFEEAARRGAKLNVRIGLASQELADFGDYLISNSTARFILGAGDDDKAQAMISRFQLTEAAGQILRNGLKGPLADGSGAPFLLQIRVREHLYEMYLLNLVGPVELWALSSTPDDTALRRRLYAAIGSAEARRRLARVFPKGTAVGEIERRRDARIRLGEDPERAAGGVIDELATELRDGKGLGAVIRDAAPSDASGNPQTRLTSNSATMIA